MASAIEAERDLRDIAKLSSAFAGGDEAKRFVESLRDRAQLLDRIRSESRPAERRRREFRDQMRAFQAVLNRADASRAGGASCPPA